MRRDILLVLGFISLLLSLTSGFKVTNRALALNKSLAEEVRFIIESQDADSYDFISDDDSDWMEDDDWETTGDDEVRLK